jgi:hypothetical protein
MAVGLKTALKMIKINWKKIFLVEDPLTSHYVGIFRTKSRRYALRGVGTPTSCSAWSLPCNYTT